jgi:hypothetical protein
MGATDNGNQFIAYDFQADLVSEDWNKAMNKLMPRGIYDYTGADLLTRFSDSTVYISPSVSFYTDTANNVSVRIENTTNATVTGVDSANCYIVQRYSWVNTAENYADYIAVDQATLQADDIIIGKAIYIGTGMQTFFDYSRTTWSLWRAIGDEHENLRVRAQAGDTSNTVYVNSGQAIINGIFVSFAGGDSPVITSTTLGRADLVCLTELGAVTITYGSEGSSTLPTIPPNCLPLASIIRTGSKTYVWGSQITNFNPYREYYNQTLDPNLNTLTVQGNVLFNSTSGTVVIKTPTTIQNTVSITNTLTAQAGVVLNNTSGTTLIKGNTTFSGTVTISTGLLSGVGGSFSGAFLITGSLQVGAAGSVITELKFV